MAVDSRQQSQLNGLGYDSLRYQQVQFSNPWVGGTSNAQSSQLYASSQAASGSMENSTQLQQRPTNISLPFSAIPATAAAVPVVPGSSIAAGIYASGAGIQDPSNLLNGRAYPQYATSASTANYVPASAPGYQVEFPGNHSRFTYQQDAARRSSHPSVPSMNPLLTCPTDPQQPRQDSLIDLSRMNPSEAQRNGFNEAIDASRGMISLSQSDITPTPRNMYGTQSNRSSPESYGFPPTHSAHSSISSASTFQSYYGGSVGDGSLTDYSSASESVDLNRTLPRPSSMVGTSMPPAPQSMMGQFSSKVSSSSQKKHKCKVCDKRFTRPSSLQTHMYSHTGEKPFACEIEGCGRHFSVVSNLRRHQKVHKGEREDSATNEA